MRNMAETISEIAAALRRRETTAEALLNRCLDRIRRIDPGLNSFVALDEAGARAAARTSEARLAAGAPRSPLEGVPLSVKDNILVAGLPATWGSRALADFVPDRDELPIARLRAAGAVILGKTNVPELTLEGYTRNDLFGVTRNPWNTRLTPGGSSGGAAAGVAAGLVPAAIGTDGGGSIRRPACHTGLVGWKPSAGHVPRVDGFPAILTDFETIGTLTRTVGDALLLDAAMAGADARDRRSLYAAAPPWPAGARRIAYVPSFGSSPVDPEVAAATAAAATALAEAGHRVVQENVPFDLDDAGRIWHVVSRAGVAWLALRDEKLAALAGASVKAMAADGQKLTGADYIDALERVAAFRRRIAELFARVDLLLTPTAAALPWPAEVPYPDRIAGRPAGPRDHAVFTGWVNIAGLPAVSLPVALSASGLPIGVQLVAGFGADTDLLAFAQDFARRHPAPPLPPMDEKA
jgi:Asp-tRNA(Asn)/Glu-tRNA(Gln) amidotransferase A subunit family amidase